MRSFVFALTSFPSFSLSSPQGESRGGDGEHAEGVGDGLLADTRAVAGEDRLLRAGSARADDTPNHTKPTGFSALPPPGPAMPVTETAKSTFSRRRAPSAISPATSDDTAPWRSSDSCETPSTSRFTAFE